MNIAIIGFGNVGRAFARILLEKKQDLEKQYGFQSKIIGIFEVNGAFINEAGLNLKEIVELDSTQFKNHKNWKSKAVTNDLIPQLNVDTVVELTHTNIETGEPGLSHIKTALNSNKHVVTANKGPLAVAFPELRELAKKNNCYLRFEATTGGAIPVFHLAETALMGNNIISIKGILNGTSNFILTQMSRQNVPFSIALKEAQELGYAEADPSLDVDGIDAACKIVIIANS
ncbi:MAG: homoserine dehydrogenase, partial [Promethearchaeota archaeon]